MIKRLALGILAVILFCSLQQSTQAQQQPFKVEVNIDCARDDDSCDKVKSYINRELRSLKDVEVSKDPDYTLNVIVTPLLIGTSVKGYAYSCVITMPMNSRLAHLLLSDLSVSYQNDFEVHFKRVRLYLLHFMEHGPDIKDSCQSIVATFDTRTLEPRRKK